MVHFSVNNNSKKNAAKQVGGITPQFNNKTRLTPVVKLWSDSSYMVHFSANNNSKGDLGSVYYVRF